MICVPIKGPTYEKAEKQILKALKHADLIEMRIDFFKKLDIDQLKRLRSNFSIPMIFTLRGATDGGGYSRSEENRLSDLRLLAELEPDYLDLETDLPDSFINEISLKHPKIKIIRSYHNFAETPGNLNAIYREMIKIPAHFYKIAVMSTSCLDTLRLISWAKGKRDKKLIVSSMGEHGKFGRVLGPIFGVQVTYASLTDSHQTALGQITAKTLVEQYNYRTLNRRTEIYGLIGDPVDQSVSDKTHNRIFFASGNDAVYVKIQVKSHELESFFKYARSLPFNGLSVTMPLKEAIIPLLDEVSGDAVTIGAVNTVRIEKGQARGFNTDASGALWAISDSCRVKDKRIVIIGAGGAAKAIAYKLLKEEGKVTILNRNAQKAMSLARSLKCIGGGIDSMAEFRLKGYDLLINCTPSPLPIDSDNILSSAVVMDIVTNPKESVFLKYAKEKGCPVIYGYQMFIEQAIEQFLIWFYGDIDIDLARKLLGKEVVRALPK